jgi:hypothetical protein
VYFVDRSLECRVVVHALQDAGANLRLHSEHFDDDEDDQVWLPEVARRGWIILTKDKRIRRRPIEKQALVASGARAFVLSSGNMRGREMADLLVAKLRKIERVVLKTNAPFVAVVTRTAVQVLQL